MDSGETDFDPAPAWPESSARSGLPALPKANVLGVRFWAAPLRTVRQAILDVLKSPDRRSVYLCPSGAHGVIEATKHAEFRAILNGAEFNVPDGMPVVFSSRLQGFSDAERAFGPDLMLHILRDSAELGVGHFFYGGREGVAEELGEALRALIPTLKVSGSYCPPFRPLSDAEKVEVADLINRSGADVVWVGLSTPKQEMWMSEMRHRLSVKLLCGVGAAFDYHTGSIRQAPTWMKRAALEWLFRLTQEPRRLWRRYAEIVPKFLFLSALQHLGLRTFDDDE